MPSASASAAHWPGGSSPSTSGSSSPCRPTTPCRRSGARSTRRAPSSERGTAKPGPFPVVRRRAGTAVASLA
eukprot:14789274-Heterocapsa_arctica.AAC.1